MTTRPIAWPAWVYETFKPEAIEGHLTEGYEHAKQAELDRSGRLSAEDFATAAVGCFRACRRRDLFLNPEW